MDNQFVSFKADWTTEQKASYLERRVIIASIAYYEYDGNFISDFWYTQMCHQLVDLLKKCNVEDTRYGYVFKDFDGSTGYNLQYELTEEDRSYLDAITRCLLGQCDVSEVAKYVI